MPAIVEAAVSVVVKPVPVTDIDAPTGPEAGDRVTTCGIIFSVAEAEVGVVVSDTIMVSERPANVFRTTNVAIVGSKV
jgi:hypothetical protein